MTSSPLPRPSLAELPGREQEQAALYRELEGYTGQDLLTCLGLEEMPPAPPGHCWAGSWCIPFADRRALFGDASLSGDVDLLAGGLLVDVGVDVLRKTANDIAAQYEHVPAIDCALFQLLEEGHLVWPPPVDFIVAMEMKVSYYDLVEGHGSLAGPRWKRTHANESRRVRGQMNLLASKGLDRVTFYHLGFTRPRHVEGMQPIMTAVHDVGPADLLFPEVFLRHDVPVAREVLPPSLEPDFGYVTKCMAGVPGRAEHDTGTVTRPIYSDADLFRLPRGYRIHQRATGASSNPGASWRASLAEALRRIQPPVSRTLVLEHGRDGWSAHRNASAAWAARSRA